MVIILFAAICTGSQAAKRLVNMAMTVKQARGPKILSAIAAPQLKAALSKAGFAATEVVTQWPAIVGESIAKRSAPLKIAFPRRPVAQEVSDPGTLFVAVEAAFALEVQHMSGTILERVNGYFGWQCVQMLKVKVVPRLARGPQAPDRRETLDGGKVASALNGIEDDALRAALERLGRHVPAQKR